MKMYPREVWKMGMKEAYKRRYENRIRKQDSRTD